MANLTASRPDGWAPRMPVVGRSRTHWQLALASLRRDRLALIGAGLVLLVVLLVLAAPIVAPFDPFQQRSELRNAPPGSEGYLLGGDELGRDILSRLLWGGRNSLKVALLPVVVSVIVGTVL